ncbi:hypothetical protein Tco_0771085 [Tanacetum coccineum]|uniref:Uncharacterized protein n=1 Tax=Tanacetum coccineum TaxID=301880 RepID=A0ABQ4ZE04_9ASTR
MVSDFENHSLINHNPKKKQGDENRTPHEVAALKAFPKRQWFLLGCFKLIGYPEWWPGKKGEKNKGKAACVKTKTDPIPRLTYEDFQLFLKHFSGTDLSDILVNKKATHFEAPVVIPNGDSILVKGKGDYILPGGTKVNGVFMFWISNAIFLFPYSP